LLSPYFFLKIWNWNCTKESAMPEKVKCACGGEYCFNRYCGCMVCGECDDHKGLARCYCGWSLSGRSGYAELEEMGETIEPEDY